MVEKAAQTIIDSGMASRVKCDTMKRLTDTLAFILENEQYPPAFQPLADFELIILVGLTGVGKSTVVEHLQQTIDFILLPNRREITDAIMIAALQIEAGETPYPVDDRIKRFEYTARYRRQHPGGMAHALSRLVVRTTLAEALLLFDGLRGLNEVQHAAAYLPKARFVVLDAPDIVRLNRLLKRADSFDTTHIDMSLADKNLVADMKTIPHLEAIFSEEQQHQIARSTRRAGYSVDEVVQKLSIIVEERRNYDSHAAIVYLCDALPSQRVLVVDTAETPAAEAAEQVQAWLGENS
jgi:hypothetical protein